MTVVTVVTVVIVETVLQTWNLSLTLDGQDFSIICLLKKRVNYEKLTFVTFSLRLWLLENIDYISNFRNPPEHIAK